MSNVEEDQSSTSFEDGDPNEDVAEASASITQQLPAVTDVGMSQIIPQTPSTVARFKSWLTQQASPAVEAGISSQPAQVRTTVALGTGLHLPQESKQAVGRVKIELSEQLTNELLLFKYIPSAVAEASASITQQLPAVTEASASIAQQLPAVTDIGMSQIIQQTPSTVARIKSQLTQQDSSAATRMRPPPTQQAPSVAIGMRPQLPQYYPSVSGMSIPFRQQIPLTVAKMRSQLTRQAPSVTDVGMSQIIPQTPSTVARIKSWLTQQASPAVEAGMSSQLAQQVRTTVALGTGLHLPQESKKAVGRVKIELSEQLTNELLLFKYIPSAVAEASASITQLPAVTETSAPIAKQKPRAATGRKAKLTAANLPSWKNLTMADALRSRSAVHMDPPNTEDSVDLGKKLPPSVRDLPEINVQNVSKGLKGHNFQLLSPSQRRPPYRSLTQRLRLAEMRRVVDLSKEKKKKVKKKKKSRCACNDDSWTTSSSDEPKSPRKSIPSSPELMFHMEL